MIRRTTVQHVKKEKDQVSVLQFEWYFYAYKITIIYIKKIMYDKTYVVKAFRSDDLILLTLAVSRGFASSRGKG